MFICYVGGSPCLYSHLEWRSLKETENKTIVGVKAVVLDQGSPRKREPVGSCREEDMEGRTFQHDVKERHCQT